MGGMASSGQGNPLGNALVKTGLGFGGQAPAPDRPTVQYNQATPNVYAPAFSSQQNGLPMAAPQQPSTIGIGPPRDMVQSPMQQPMQSPVQQMQRPMMVPQYGGLQSLFNAMMMQQRMQPMRSMPMYQSPALGFRPNMQPIQQNLSRVQPSVYKSDLDTARARIAELEAQLQPRGGD